MSGDNVSLGNSISKSFLEFQKRDKVTLAEQEKIRTARLEEEKSAQLAQKSDTDTYSTKAPETKVTFAYQKSTNEDAPIKKLKPPAPDKLSNSDANAA